MGLVVFVLVFTRLFVRVLDLTLGLGVEGCVLFLVISLFSWLGLLDRG